MYFRVIFNGGREAWIIIISCLDRSTMHLQRHTLLKMRGIAANWKVSSSPRPCETSAPQLTVWAIQQVSFANNCTVSRKAHAKHFLSTALRTPQLAHLRDVGLTGNKQSSRGGCAVNSGLNLWHHSCQRQRR